jgi:glycosyltransferase involved in cell wall biosynthesis
MIAPTSFFADYGCHVRIYEEAHILQKLGHQVTIVTYRNGNAVPGLHIERTLPIPWRTHYEVGSSRHKLGFDVLLGLKTLQLLARNRYDVIHAHLHEGALLGLVMSRLFGLPLVFDFQGSLTEEMIDHRFLQRDSRVYKPLRRLEEWIDRSAPVIFTSSAHAARLLTEQFGCDPDSISPLPDCVNTSTFCPASEFDPQELAALRQRLGIPADSQVIVYLGLLAEYQGTSLLLEAMQRVLQQRPNTYLLLMGFPGVQQYRAKAVQLGIGERVILTGRVPYVEAAKYLALGQVATAPKLSLTEGAGKLLLYMAMALPTVAFETPVAREYLGIHGLFATRGDVQSLADKLLTALAAPELGNVLRQRAIQHFEWHKAGQQIVGVYQRLLKHDQAGLTQPVWSVPQK